MQTPTKFCRNYFLKIIYGKIKAIHGTKSTTRDNLKLKYKNDKNI